ncbi:MAG TPA: hypothetical protein VFJ82_14130 [Longimicrobium sp.]|nr:hypothetical protein [Longimicrobium sp.]
MTRNTRRILYAAPAALVLGLALGACSDRTPTAPARKPKEQPLANVSYTTTNTTTLSSFKWHPGETCASSCDVQINITEEVVNENNAVTYSGETGQFGATINGTTASVPTVFVSPHRNTSEKLRFTLRKAIGTGIPSSWTNCGSVMQDMPTSSDSYTVTFPANSTCPSGGTSLAVVNVSWSRGDYAIATITVPATTMRQYDVTTVTPRTYAANGTQITGQTISMSSSSTGTVEMQGCSGPTCTLKAQQAGTATLTASDYATGVTGTGSVTVTARPVTRVDVTPTTYTVHPNGTVTLTAKSYDAANTEITGAPAPSWSSANTSLASIVSTSGNTATVQGGGSVGSTSVSATVAGVSGSATVSVVPGVSSLTLNKYYAYNENVTATAAVAPAGSYYYQWQYRFCSNSTLASDCNGAYYAGTSGVNVTSLTKYVYARDYWVEFIVTVRASATGTIYDTQSIRVDGAGQSSGSTGGGGTGGGGGGGCTTTAC